MEFCGPKRSNYAPDVVGDKVDIFTSCHSSCKCKNWNDWRQGWHKAKPLEIIAELAVLMVLAC
jgi:hypothetical protein